MDSSNNTNMHVLIIIIIFMFNNIITLAIHFEITWLILLLFIHKI
jgi:hypothetical protein